MESEKGDNSEGWKVSDNKQVAKIEPVVVSEARGATIKDVTGREYIDCFQEYLLLTLATAIQ